MEDDCIRGVWRFVYVDHRDGFIYLCYFHTLGVAQQFFDCVCRYSHYSLLGCQFWDSFNVRWKEVKDFDSLLETEGKL